MYWQTPDFKGILKLISFLPNPGHFHFCINNCFPREFLDFIRLPKLSIAWKNHCTMLYVNEADRARSGVNMNVHMHVYVSAMCVCLRAGMWECKWLASYWGWCMSENRECLLSSCTQSFPFPLIAPVSLNLQEEGVGNVSSMSGL